MKKLRKIIVWYLALILCCSTVIPTYSVQAATVKLNATKVTLYGVGDTYQLKLQNATKVSWSSSNKKVVTVSTTGKTTAKKAGSCTITATNKNTGKKYKCSVKVVDVNLNATSIQIYGIGDTYKLKLSNVPKALWTSSDKTIATVSSTGKVTAKKVGNCTITATNKINKKEYTCKVKVVEVALNKTEIRLANIGDTYQLELSNVEKVSWSSSDKSIATVSSTGKVTAKKVGNCIITAKNQKTGETYQCEVSVYRGMKRDGEIFLTIPQLIGTSRKHLTISCDPKINGYPYTILIDDQQLIPTWELELNGDGFHIIELDVSQFADGIHVIKMKAGNMEDSSQFILSNYFATIPCIKDNKLIINTRRLLLIQHPSFSIWIDGKEIKDLTSESDKNKYGYIYVNASELDDGLHTLVFKVEEVGEESIQFTK